MLGDGMRTQRINPMRGGIKVSIFKKLLDLASLAGDCPVEARRHAPGGRRVHNFPGSFRPGQWPEGGVGIPSELAARAAYPAGVTSTTSPTPAGRCRCKEEEAPDVFCKCDFFLSFPLALCGYSKKKKKGFGYDEDNV
ncbi:hypothetical protein BT93_J1502 [Corymbia citriodora subsp. variegata]|nr:hypothetical protein BT93_J1502 [Corymbia citriodora subsp. variegata]